MTHNCDQIQPIRTSYPPDYPMRYHAIVWPVAFSPDLESRQAAAAPPVGTKIKVFSVFLFFFPLLILQQTLLLSSITHCCSVVQQMTVPAVETLTSGFRYAHLHHIATKTPVLLDLGYSPVAWIDTVQCTTSKRHTKRPWDNSLIKVDVVTHHAFQDCLAAKRAL